MKDFTFSQYYQLLTKFQEHNYKLISYKQYQLNSFDDFLLIIRHDVDRKPENALKMARIEHELGLRTSYYFRIVKESFNETIIKKIAELGHEIGYHYEDLALCKNNYENAIKLFEENLNKIRKLYPVVTMCMHGSPLSKSDNKDLWKRYDYKEYGIIAEPYFDLNFNEIFYITDASRGWNNSEVTLRDIVETSYHIPISSANNIIELLKIGTLPSRIMINIHPHNWAKSELEWLTIIFWQTFKNFIKKIVKT